MFVCMSLGVDAQRVYATDLSDDAWALIEPMLPVPATYNKCSCGVERDLLSTPNRLSMALASERVPRLEHGVSLLSELG